jgi:hypothetical protein
MKILNNAQNSRQFTHIAKKRSKPVIPPSCVTYFMDGPNERSMYKQIVFKYYNLTFEE